MPIPTENIEKLRSDMRLSRRETKVQRPISQPESNGEVRVTDAGSAYLLGGMNGVNHWIENSFSHHRI